MCLIFCITICMINSKLIYFGEIEDLEYASELKPYFIFLCVGFTHDFTGGHIQY